MERRPNVLQHGYRLGVIGDSDSHCTTHGGFAPMAYHLWSGRTLFPYVGGVAAVYARESTRTGLFEAIRARRRYATSCEKILVWTELAGAPMGLEIESSSVDLDILFSCTHEPLIQVLVIKDGKVAARFGDFGQARGFDAKRKTFHLVWHDEEFSAESAYYVRATQFDGDMAWSSPIRIRLT